jgi:hypothetical protein
MSAINGAIHEGKAAYTLGSTPDANPYRKYLENNTRPIELWVTKFDSKIGTPNRIAELRDLECQWDSGYAIAKREVTA